MTAVQGWMKQLGVPWTARNAYVLAGYGDTLPSNLNFAVQGTIGFTYPNSSYSWSCSIILAQGHSFLTNNWWMFATQALSGSGQFAVPCSLNGGAPYLVPAGQATKQTANQFMFGTE